MSVFAVIHDDCFLTGDIIFDKRNVSLPPDIILPSSNQNFDPLIGTIKVQ